MSTCIHIMHASLQHWLAIAMHAHAKAMSNVASVSCSSKKTALNLCCWNMPRSVQPGFANMCDVKPTLLHTLLVLRSTCEAWIWKRNISIETLPSWAMMERDPRTLTRHLYAFVFSYFSKWWNPFFFCDVKYNDGHAFGKWMWINVMPSIFINNSRCDLPGIPFQRGNVQVSKIRPATLAYQQTSRVLIQKLSYANDAYWTLLNSAISWLG